MNVHDATCPLCRAKPGQLCRNADSRELEAAHAERQNLARLGPCSRCGADVGEPCSSKRKGMSLYECWVRMECLGVSCGYCWAVAGDLCRTPGGQVRGPHMCRIDVAKRSATVAEVR